MASDSEKLIECENKLLIKKKHLRFYTDNFIKSDKFMDRENQT